jgi:hypothetical protein
MISILPNAKEVIIHVHLSRGKIGGEEKYIYIY